LPYFRTSTAYSYLAGAPLAVCVATRTILVRHAYLINPYVVTRTILVRYAYHLVWLVIRGR